MNETPVTNCIKSSIFVMIAIIAIFMVWYVFKFQLGQLLLQIPGLDDELAKLPRIWITSIVYTIALIYFFGVFFKIAHKIVNQENQKFKKDHEESLIKKSWTLAIFNGFQGLFQAAFYRRDYQTMCAILITLMLF